jgi:(2Fe-2S) ferredoxin
MSTPFYDRHVFVCMNDREEGHPRGCCGSERGGEIKDTFKKEMRRAGLKGVRSNKAGCLDRCELGPCVVVYPEGIWYRIDNPESDVREIVEQHFVNGKIVARLRLPE